MARQTQCWAVVPAAGVGARVGAHLPKQYLHLSGKPLISYTLDALLNCDFISGVSIAVSNEDQYWSDLTQTSHTKFKQCIGGKNRADSVLAGIRSLDKADDHDWVMVHDAARPCITTEQLASLYASLCHTEQGGLWAIPVADTLKYVEGQQSLRTIDRSAVWRAQTPQMFRIGTLRNALNKALSHNTNITDEASAMELSGFRPEIIEGFTQNIKVTYANDVKLAEFYLAQLSGDIQ